MLIDPPQLDLVEPGIARYGRIVAVHLRREIDVAVSSNHHVHFFVLTGDGKFVRRIQGRLRRDELPGADAEVCGTNLKGGNQPDQNEFIQWFLLETGYPRQAIK